MATGTRTDSRREKISAEAILLNGTLVTATAAEINAAAGSGITAAIMTALVAVGTAGLAFLTSVVAGTAAASKAMVLDANKGISAFRITSAVAPYFQASYGALNATGTATATLLLGGAITSTTAAAVTATLDTATNLDTAYLALFPNGAVSDAFELNVVNTGANTFTFSTAAGWTDAGNAFTAVAAGTSATFRIRRTAANNFHLSKIG